MLQPLHKKNKNDKFKTLVRCDAEVLKVLMNRDNITASQFCLEKDKNGCSASFCLIINDHASRCCKINGVFKNKEEITV